MFALAIESSFVSRVKKKESLYTLRTKIEIAKQLIRIANEISVYTDKTYISLQEKLQEISKMTVGWLKYVTQNPV